MTSFKLVWVSKSPYSTELQSDTIFGHFAWAIRYIKGSPFLTQLIEELKRKPSLVLSSAFPEGMLPTPVLPLPPGIFKQNPAWDKYRKQLKEWAYVPSQKLLSEEFVFDWADHFTSAIETIKQAEAKAGKEKTQKPKRDIVFHNSINRLTGTTSAGDGNLYAAESTFIPTDYKLESYLFLESDVVSEADLPELFEYISATGFGKDKSTGKGRFDISYQKADFPAGNEDSVWLNLSNMVPAASDPLRAYYRGFTKFGKLGGSFALLETPFKYPIFMLKPGSVFIGRKPEGSVLTDVHPQSGEYGIIQNLYSFSVPFNFKHEEV